MFKNNHVLLIFQLDVLSICQLRSYTPVNLISILQQSMKFRIIIVLGPRYFVNESFYLGPSSTVGGRTHVLNFLLIHRTMLPYPTCKTIHINSCGAGLRIQRAR